MKGSLYIGQVLIGETHFKILDKSMGAIHGVLSPSSSYSQIKSKVQVLYEIKGNANNEDFDFRLEIDDIGRVNTEGGIGIIDAKNFDEIILECAGISHEILEQIERDFPNKG